MFKFFKYSLLLLLFFLISENSQAKIDLEQYLEQYRYVNFQELADSYKEDEREIVQDILSDKKIRINNEHTKYFNRIYYEPARRYITQIRYLGQFRDLSKNNKEFLINWNKVKNLEKFNIRKNRVDQIGVEEGLENFYEEMLITYNRQVEWVPIQKIIAEDLKKSLPSAGTQYIHIHFLVIGRINRELPIMIITNYDLPSKIKKEQREKADYEIGYDEVSNILRLKNPNYTRRALLRMTALQRKYPDNDKIKADVCLLTRLDADYEGAIQCYKNLLSQNIKIFEVYYGLGVTQYYHNVSNNEVMYRESVSNLTKAIGLFSSSGDEQALYNALYARALAKIKLRDKTAIDDLEKINRIRPDLVSVSVIENVKTELGVL